MKSKNRETKHDSAVGFCNPPTHSRFKKGVSGNPSGRPKRQNIVVDLAAVLEQIDSEEIVVIDSGKRKRMSKMETNFRQLVARATKGDLKAARQVFKMAKEYFAEESQRDFSPEIISQSDAIRRFGPNWQKYARNMSGSAQP